MPSRFARRACAVAAASLLVARGGAQPLAAPLAFERIGQERGLSNGTVTAIVQDRTGFVWFGTEDGLDRYDGTSFAVYRPTPGDTTSIADGWVTGLLVARDGTLWASTLHGGVARYRPERDDFRRYRHGADPRSLSSDRTNALIEAGDGAIWVGTVRGIDRLDPRTGAVRRYAIDPVDSSALANDVLALADDGRGRILVGGRTGVFVLDPVTGAFAQVTDDAPWAPVRAIRRDRLGHWWVATENALLTIDVAAARVARRWGPQGPGRPSPIGGRVLTLADGPDGTLLVGSDGGLTVLDPATFTWRRHEYERANARSLGGAIVRAALVDRGQVLWAGLESFGISKHARSAVRFDVLRHDPAARNTLSDGYVRGMAEDRAGDLWIGTQNGGLDRRDRRTGKITVYRHDPRDPRSLPGDAVWAVHEDRAGVLWVGMHYGGLGTLDPATGRFARSPHVPAGAKVNVIVEDRAGRLLVGTEGEGLYEISADRRTAGTYGATIGAARVLTNNDVQTIHEDGQGFLWVGGVDGLTRLDRRTGRATHFRGEPGRVGALGTDFVTHVMEDAHGRLWIATKGAGLARYDAATNRFTTYGVSDGLPHPFVYGVLEDALGRIWVSTDDGLAALDPRTGAVARFGLGDGLQGREFNRRAFLRGRDGTMYFGGTNGLNVFQPDRVAAATAPPPVSIIAVRQAGAAERQMPDTAGRIALPHDRTAFTVSYAALDYSAPEKVRYAYRLEGVDRAWVQAGDRREASYASLRPGRYVFRVAAANAAGVWNLDGARVTIVVDPPWWATWWARLGMVLGAAGVVGLILRLRLRADRRRSEARLRDAVEASLDALVVFDARRDRAGRVTDFAAAECNERAVAFAGMDRAAIRGCAPAELFPGAGPSGLLAACAQVAMTGEPYVLEYATESPDGPMSWTRCQVVRVGDGVAVTARDVTQQKASEAALRELALVDELTGVQNRRGFLVLAERLWHRAAVEQVGALLAYFDVNEFKHINDTFGHAAGDDALRAVGDVLRAAFRGADVIGRLGGDEFAVLVVPTPAYGGEDVEDIERLVRERLTHHLVASNDAARARGRPYEISLSLGVARTPRASSLTLAALMHEADERLYDEKRDRRARPAEAR